MRENWVMWSGAFDDAFIKRIEDAAPPVEKALITSQNDDEEEERVSRTSWLNGEEWLQNEIFKYVTLANAHYFKANVWNSTPLQYTEYHAEDTGFYNWHTDVNWLGQDDADRKLSVTIQLSDPDEYEGGDFEFQFIPGPEQEAAKKKGTILIFPSHQIHRVTNVTKGVRKSLVAWFEGPRWV